MNPTETVKVLLARGANPSSIPRDMWEDFLESPAVFSHKEDHIGVSALPKQSMWCQKFHRRILAETLNLSIRYFLHKSSQLALYKLRGTQLAQAHDYAAFLKVPYVIVGQAFACKFVVEHVTSHIGMSIKSPLVLTFAGLSGHGKTEL